MHLTDEQLMRRVEGPLDAEAEAHLKGCAQCRAAAEETAAIWRHLPSELVEPSPGFDARLRARLDAEDERRQAGWFRWAWAAPSFAAALGLILVLATPASSERPVDDGDLQMLAELELLDDLDAAELVDVYSDLELIESLDGEEG
ncbi:MAG: hypothetical protein AAGD10_17310 [Myxococcota bacterium]